MFFKFQTHESGRHAVGTEAQRRVIPTGTHAETWSWVHHRTLRSAWKMLVATGSCQGAWQVLTRPQT